VSLWLFPSLYAEPTACFHPTHTRATLDNTRHPRNLPTPLATLIIIRYFSPQLFHLDYSTHRPSPSPSPACRSGNHSSRTHQGRLTPFCFRARYSPVCNNIVNAPDVHFSLSLSLSLSGLRLVYRSSTSVISNRSPTVHTQVVSRSSIFRLMFPLYSSKGYHKSSSVIVPRVVLVLFALVSSACFLDPCSLTMFSPVSFLQYGRSGTHTGLYTTHIRGSQRPQESYPPALEIVCRKVEATRIRTHGKKKDQRSCRPLYHHKELLTLMSRSRETSSDPSSVRLYCGRRAPDVRPLKISAGAHF